MAATAVLSTSMVSIPNPATAFPGRLQLLWDEMADFDAAQHDEALDHLLRGLTVLLSADRAGWYAAIRPPQGAEEGSSLRWRPRLLRVHEPAHASGGLVTEDPETSVDSVRDAAFGGQLRALRLADVAPRARSPRHGDADVLWVLCPVNSDIEVHVTFLRAPGRPPFTTAERDLAAAALSSLRWFHRQYLLSHGLLVANAPLSTAEREVLSGLLSAMSEREIAVAQGRTLNTTHEYVKTIYRKFNVKSRAALMALWLGRPV